MCSSDLLKNPTRVILVMAAILRNPTRVTLVTVAILKNLTRVIPAMAAILKNPTQVILAMAVTSLLLNSQLMVVMGTPVWRVPVTGLPIRLMASSRNSLVLSQRLQLLEVRLAATTGRSAS